MAVTSSTNKATFTQSGTTTEFSLEVKCFSLDEVKVYTKIAGVQTEVTTGITKEAVSGDLDNGVTVTFDTAPVVGASIILLREVAETQIFEIDEGGILSAKDLEDSLDRNVMISQQIGERFGRSATFPVSDAAGLNYTFSSAEQRANKAAGFDESGNLTEIDLASTGAIGVDTSKGLVLASNIISGKVDDVTVEFSGGNIAVKGGGISATQLASDAVTTAKILNSNVTKAKIENVTNMRVLGNVSGSAASPAEVVILDSDTMTGAAATNIPSSESVKAYVDSFPLRTQFLDGTGTELSTTLSISAEHSLGAIPRLFQAILYCTATDVGYALGDVVDALACPQISTWANATYCGISRVTAITMPHKTTGVVTAIDESKWSVFFRAWY